MKMHTGRRNDGQKDNQTEKLKLIGAFSQIFVAIAQRMEQLNATDYAVMQERITSYK
jgi:hypothetical protein